MNFRNRLNSAFQAVSNVIRTVCSRFFTFCKTKPVEVISVVGVIASLYYSQKSLDKTVDAINQSDAQFQDNNKSQDEQDKRSREQHDSLMSVLKQQKTLLDLQLVSLKQQNEIVSRNLGVSKTQLKLAEEIQKREIEGGRCLLTIEGDPEIKDTSKRATSFWNPTIYTFITNKGKRPCLSYKIEVAVVSKNGELLFPNKKFYDNINPINNGQIIRHSGETLVDDNKEFYYFVKLIYEDELIKKKYVTEYYFHYKLIRNEYIFFHAMGEEINKIQKALKGKN